MPSAVIPNPRNGPLMDLEALWRIRLTDFVESGLSQNPCCEERGSSAKALRHRALIASLIETAKFNGIEQFQCLQNTLETMVSGFSASRIDELLPVREG